MNLINKFDVEIAEIAEFKDITKRYFVLNNQARLPVYEHEEKRQLREKLNLKMPVVSRYVRKCGVSTTVYYTPPPIIGGMAGNVDIYANMYNLAQFEIPEQTVIDSLDKAIGTYYLLQKEYKCRIVNPFYWVGLIIKIPFRIAGFAGFDVNKLELSLLGRLYKLITAFIVLIAAVVTILQYGNIKIADVWSLFRR